MRHLAIFTTTVSISMRIALNMYLWPSTKKEKGQNWCKVRTRDPQIASILMHMEHARKWSPRKFSRKYNQTIGKNSFTHTTIITILMTQKNTIIANNIEQQSREDILKIASKLFYSVNDSVKVVAAKNQE